MLCEPDIQGILIDLYNVLILVLMEDALRGK